MLMWPWGQIIEFHSCSWPLNDVASFLCVVASVWRSWWWLWNVITKHKVTTGSGKSWKVLEFRKTIFQAREVMENSKGHRKSWKISIMSWILWNFYNCTEKFCNEILLTVITVALSSWHSRSTNSCNCHCIRKSCIVYLEKYAVPMGHEF